MAAGETNIFSEMGGTLFSRMFGSILYFGIAILIISVLGGLIWYFVIHRRRFDITVKVISNRADDNHKVFFDKAAILTDKETRTPYFRVWGLRRDFPVPTYNVLQTTDKGDYLEIFRESEEQFYYLLPPAIDTTQIMKQDGKIYPITEQSQVVFDPEMGFWAAKRKSMNKKMFDPENLFMKLIPYLPQLLGGVILIFVLYILMDNLPAILTEMRQLANTMNQMKLADVTVGG
jgi:hypothetical protein